MLSGLSRHRSRAVAVLLVGLISVPAFALFSRAFNLQIQVVDAQNRPVPYATVWVGRFDEDPAALAGFMRREAARAGTAYDFVVDVSHSVIVHTNAQGRVEFEDNVDDRDRSGHTRLELVAYKRGFQAAFAGLDAKRGSRPPVTLRLISDPAQAVEPRMELLDRAYAIASDAVDAGTTESNRETIEDLVRRLRELALQFEREGSNELASAIYFNLAYLPAVDIFKDEYGRVVASGYTNGFDERNPQRVADRARAVELSPNLLPMRQLRIRGLLQAAHRPGTYAEPVATRAALREAEKLIQEYPHTVPADVLHMVYMGYWSIEDDEASCRWLRAFYAYEPAYFEAPRTWATSSGGRAFNRKGEKQIPVDCPLPGIVPIH